MADEASHARLTSTPSCGEWNGGCRIVGYVISEGVDTMLDVIGVGWPNVDEDAYRDMADALREFADDGTGGCSRRTRR
jgi:hypothetical protein